MTDDLADRAKGAAPGAPAGEHLGEAVLARLRTSDDERDEDADAYRHLASCAACRARMASLAKGDDQAAQQVVDTAQPKPLAQVVALPRRFFAKPFALLAAAAVLIFAVSTIFRGADHRLAVHTRSYAGTMGSADAAPIASDDANVEVWFESKEPIAARLIVLDAKGNKLAPARPFTREGTKMHVVVAPRTFAAHEGKALGYVIAGTEPIVAATTDEAMALPELSEKYLKTIAERQGAWLERLEF